MDAIAARTEPPAQLDEFCESEFELLDRDPKYLPETCRAAIERYPIRAIGTRPKDYMAHNLIRRTLNDARLDRLRGAWQKPPDWAVARVSELPGAGSPGTPYERGLQLTALHYAQLHQLGKIRCSGCIDDSEQLARRWLRLWACPPSGALYQEHPGAKPCGLVHLCPWCRIRLGVRLWLQLEAGLGPDAQLLMLSSRFHLAGAGGTLWRRQREGLVPSDPVGLYVYDEAFNDICVREFVPPGWYDPPPRTAADERRDGVADEMFPSEPRQKDDKLALLSSDWVNQARAWLSRNLRDLAALLQLPSSDGCTIITVEPATWQGAYGFLYRQHRFRGYFLAPLPAIQSRPKVWACLQSKIISMTDYSRHDTQILKIDSARHLLEEALAWPPIYLYDPEQWGNYAAQTWRRPLYVPCGAWRKMLAEPAPANPAPVNPVCSPPTSPRLISLWRGTRRRQYDRDANHQKLLKIAKPIWAAMLAEPGPPARGRPAHKRRLVELLAERGIHVSGRPLRRLMAALKLTTE